MKNEFDVSKILSRHDLKGSTVKEKIEDCYKVIGQYLINHSIKLAEDVEPNIGEIELKIKIPYDFVVTLEKKTNYYVMKENENE